MSNIVAMEQYIKKSAIMAEIRRYIKSAEAFLKYHHNRNDKSVYAFEQQKLVMCDLLYFIDTLEVKEVDLKKELNDFIEEQKAWVKDDRVVEYNNGDSFNHIYDLEEIARHFYELGMQVNNKAQKGE